MEIDRLVAVMEILRKTERDRKWEQLYVSGTGYGYKKNGVWYESDQDGNVVEVGHD